VLRPVFIQKQNYNQRPGIKGGREEGKNIPRSLLLFPQLQIPPVSQTQLYFEAAREYV
jgi:hypothetical protein